MGQTSQRRGGGGEQEQVVGGLREREREREGWGTGSGHLEAGKSKSAGRRESWTPRKRESCQQRPLALTSLPSRAGVVLSSSPPGVLSPAGAGAWPQVTGVAGVLSSHHHPMSPRVAAAGTDPQPAPPCLPQRCADLGVHLCAGSVCWALPSQDSLDSGHPGRVPGQRGFSLRPPGTQDAGESVRRTVHMPGPLLAGGVEGEQSLPSWRGCRDSS